MGLDLRPESTTREPTSGTDALTHWLCCTDDDATYCGSDTSGPVVDDDTDATCVVCVDLATDVTYCPKYGRCTG